MQRAGAAARSGEIACREPWTQEERALLTLDSLDSDAKINTVPKTLLAGDEECLHLDLVN